MKKRKAPVETARELSLRLWDFAEIYFERLYYQDMIFIQPFLRRLAEDIYEHVLSVDDLKDFITYNRSPMTSPDKDFVQRVIMYCERYRVKIPTAMFAQKYAMTKIADGYYRIETAEKQVFEAAKDFYLKESNKLQIQTSQLLSELAAL